MKKLFCVVGSWFKKVYKRDDKTVTNNKVNKAHIPNLPLPTTQKQEIKEEEKIMMKILIDNGHGINTPGKRSPYSSHGTKPEIPFLEYEWNREIANPLVQKLREAGYDADILVPEEEDVPLKERCDRVNKICNELGKSNVILVSVHSNAGGNGKDWYKAQGWSAYTTPGQTMSDKLADCLYDSAEEIFKGRKIRTDKQDGDRDWEENFYILKHTLCPAVLTENFFYDNVDDVKFILSEEGKEAVINCHFNGIIKFVDEYGKK